MMKRTSRWRLPYGRWTCEDGREVLFDRFYDPIAEKSPGQPAQLVPPTGWVTWVKQEWLYDDGTPEYEKQARAQAALAEWGLAVSKGRLRLPKEKLAKPGEKSDPKKL